MAEVILSTDNICKKFGGVQALQDIAMQLKNNEIHALIGANGAGKTTLLHLLSGLQTCDSGRIFFDNSDITKSSVDVRSCSGIAYALQVAEVFDNFTLAENMAMAKRGKPNDKPLEELQKLLPSCKKDILAGELNHGHKKLLQLAMVLAAEPKLLILDEPTQGLSQAEITRLIKRLQDYKEVGAVLLVEHNMDVVMDIADSISVLNFGEILQVGTPKQIRASKKVQEAYLGKSHA